MKLSEVIKAIEDGSKSEYKINGFYGSIISCKILSAILFGENAFPINGWEEVKPPRQWSEKELMLFKLLPDWAKWIAKDEYDDSIYVYSDKPVKKEDVFDSTCGATKRVSSFETILDDILTLTFEESPVYIGDMKGE